MADPPPLHGVIRGPEVYAAVLRALPPAQPFVHDDGAVARPEIVAMPTLGHGVTFDAATAAIGVNPNLADSQHDEAWRSHQAAIATATVQPDAVQLPQGIVPSPSPATDATTENALMEVGLEPDEGITLEQAVVDFPPPVHTPEMPWNRTPNGTRTTYTMICMSRLIL
jgi:hypothetical protein